MVADDDQPLLPSASRVVAGRYRLGPRRGSSIDAALFEAFDDDLQRPVVIKMVHPEISDLPEVQAAFRDAMDLAGSLHHPNIAVAHAWGSTDWNGRKVLYVVSEQLTGGSLRDMLDRGRMLAPSQALVVGLDACKALDAMHRRGLMHGDIRPGTLVFGEDRRLRVVDAGLSQVLSQAAGGPTSRINDLAKYTSPEEAVGGPLEPKSDVYSLCLTLLESVTGAVPFVGDSTVATLANRVDKLMPVSADMGALASVLERAGRPLAADRYSAAEFGRALVQAAERLPRPAPLPILVNSLFGADPGGPDQPVEPTGPLVRPAGPAPEPISGPAVVAIPIVADVMKSADDSGPLPAPTTPAVDAPPPVLQSSPAAPPAAATAMSTPVEHEPVDDVVVPVAIESDPGEPDPQQSDPEQSDPDESDPDDDFPDRPPTVSGGRRWFIALLVVMAAVGGALAWYSARPEKRTVPDLAGMAQGVALNAVAGDFKASLAEEASETVPVGVVIRTDPVSGTSVEKNSALTLYVSTGPAPRTLPELVGLTVADATAKLDGMGLVVEVADAAYSEDVASGVVLSWVVPDSPTLVAGGTVTKGTAVRIIPSAGPAPRTVPDLTNVTLVDATTSLQSMGLVIAQGPDEFSPTVPAGTVLRQDPAPGASVERGATVTVVVSKGPDLVAIPNLDGLDASQIGARLVAAGFTIGVVNGDTTQPFRGLHVDGKLALEGYLYPRGTAVELFFF